MYVHKPRVAWIRPLGVAILVLSAVALGPSHLRPVSTVPSVMEMGDVVDSERRSPVGSEILEHAATRTCDEVAKGPERGSQNSNRSLERSSEPVVISQELALREWLVIGVVFGTLLPRIWSPRS